ncbi:Mini-chromosome maintenance protein [Phytophthora cactorum]|nr:Mini-chromosome maintenance protein [Phytophthora cactorum]
MALLSLNGFFRFASAVVGFMLFIVACAGFNTLKLSVSSVDIQAQFGCLCFLGVCFGLLLTFGESKWELFFFFFGFMRYRLGRACIFAVSGIMTAILGKTRNQQCDCNDNVIIIIEGVALVAMAILQTLAIFIFGNNSAPRCNTETVRLPAAIQLAVTDLLNCVCVRRIQRRPALANGLEDSENDSDDDDSRDRKRRRLRRGDAPSSTPADAPASPTLSQIANGDDADDVDDFAEELDEEIVDELDIQERERQYFSEDELDDDVDGEDLGENAEMDYRHMETLDRYDTAMLDTRQYEDMDLDTRRAVEDELNRRDAREGRIAQVFQEDQEMEHDDAHRRRFRQRQEGQDGYDEEFRNFLNTFSDGKGRLVYHEKIVQLAQRNEQSLEIEIGDVIHSMSMVAAWLVEAPKDMLAILDEVAQEVVLALFPYYSTIPADLRPYSGSAWYGETARLAHGSLKLPYQGFRCRDEAYLQLVKVNCPGCGAVLGPFTQQSQQEVKLNACPECQFRGHFPVNSEQTVYRNFQKITLQESPGSVPPGRVPRSKDVVLVGDLIDKARPGDEIAVTGIYTNTPDPTLNLRDGFPVFRTVIEANHQLLTAEDKKQILRLAKQPDIAQRIINSIAPSIYGHQQFIKNSRVRGDLNVLLVGDPGTAKSQFLKFAKQTAPRAVYSTGKGASAVGLTAGVSRDPFTKEWVLQGDKGVCLIDEFDKMNEQDRTSIHEAMEQQSISVSKAGIVTSLQARCSVIAAANPIGGRYNAARTFAENVELTDPILQRFDLLCVLQDKVDPVDDERLADFVVSKEADQEAEDGADDEEELSAMTQSMQVGDSDASMTLDQELLRKYILYARTYVNPVLASGLDTGKVEAFYAQLRRASQHTGAVPVAVRHLESLFRMAEAHARMHLRDTVGDEDLALAIRVLTESLCDAQKFTFKRQWRRLFRPYLTYRQDNNVLLLHVLHELFKSAHAYQQLRMQTNAQAGHRSHKETTLTVLRDDLLSKAKSVGIYDLSEFYESAAFAKAGFRIDEATNSIIKDI